MRVGGRVLDDGNAIESLITPRREEKEGVKKIKRVGERNTVPMSFYARKMTVANERQRGCARFRAGPKRVALAPCGLHTFCWLYFVL